MGGLRRHSREAQSGGGITPVSRRQAGGLALLVSVPGWAAILALLAVNQISPPAAALTGAGVLLLAMGVARYLTRDVARLRGWLRGRGTHMADTAVPVSGMLGDLAGDVRRLEKHWQQQQTTQANQIADHLAMLDGLPDPVLTLDERASVVFANDAARALLVGDDPVDGLTADPTPDPTGRALSSLLRHPGLLAPIGAVIDGEPGRRIEVTLAGKVDRFVEAWVEPLAGAHGALVLVVVRDMTALRRGEGVRADFVANVSHELRTPLASLLGFIETLRGPAADDRAAQSRFLTLMDEQAARMARLVDDLLSLSRIEMNEHQPPATQVVLPTLLQSLADQLATLAAQAGVTVAINAAPDLPAVQGDADDLARLFQNLIENAIKYGREGSAVTVTVTAGDNTADSIGRRNSFGFNSSKILVQGLGGCLPIQRLSRPHVKCQGDCLDFVCAVGAEVGSFREVLA